MVKKEGLFYLRFLYMAVVSFMALTSWNPALIALVSSFMLLVTIVVHSSVSCRNNAFSMFMYIIVLLMLLCPRIVLTCIMSLVSW